MCNSKPDVAARRALRLLLALALCLGLAVQVGLGTTTGGASARAADADVTGGDATAVAGIPAAGGTASSLTPVEGPAGEAFYVPPSPLPAGQPGDVIWYRKAEPVSVQGGTALDVGNAWQVLYLSTNALGRPDAVSGMVLLPKGGSPESLPIIGFAPGTHGIDDKCALSRQGITWTDYESLAIAALLNRGWAVALTDYEGLGTPGTHTYMVGRSQGAALLDVVRAARGLPATGLSATSPVALYGYSQGGGASGWAVEMQPSYAPELPLRGAVAGGVPADLAAVQQKLDGGLGFAFLAMASLGLDAAYPELKLDAYLTSAGRTGMVEAAKICMTEALIRYAGKRISDYTTENPLSTPAWRARVDQQRLGRRPPRVPVFLAHGLQDEFIPYDQAVRLRQDWCAAGATVDWRDYVGEHAITLAAMQSNAMDFVANRLAGRSVRSSC
jgi:pimeloyl-ACP methyl ester carboxylesterase